ncbi:hypothetical protein [Microbacterium gilvum]|uniref:Uncharacterized protein n=1 Tax=Microbacterium gilvum TaxID=1336204 RepID=A0ABP9A5Z8_9MICO
MSRDRANIRTDIWNDDDFRRLSAEAQFLYLQLLTSATLTYVGVADWRPKRIAALSAGRAPGTVEKAAQELVDGLYVVIDEMTEEILIRSFLRHDGLLQKPNVAKAMVKAYDGVYSLDLKGVVVHELNRLHKRFPDWKGFDVREVREVMSKGSVNPSDLLTGTVPLTLPERDAPLLTTSTATSTSHSLPAPSELDTVFERAYKSWPKKTEKKKSAEKFKLLAKKHDPEWLAEQVVKFGRAYTSTTEARYVPALVVWLNGERWTDDLPTASPTVINTQWDQLMNTPTDPCSIGHLWVRDGTCARCTARKDMT